MSEPPADGNRTVFRPSPLQGLKAAAAVAQPAASSAPTPPSDPRRSPLAAARLRSAAAPAIEQRAEAGYIFRNVMLDAASPVLALAAGLRSGRVRLPLGQFHRQATQAIADLDRATQGAYPEEVRRRARYALCATIDDIAQNLPGQGTDGAEWARRSLVAQAFQASLGGERFWQLVDEAIGAPADHRDLAELYLACLAAGFEDRYRAMPDGKRRLRDVMARLRDAVPGPALPAGEISPHWRGEAAPAARLGIATPVAVAVAATAAILLLIYIAFRLMLLHGAVEPAAAVAAINPDGPLRLSRGGASVAPPPASREAGLLRAALAPAIAAGGVVIEEDAASVRVRTIAGPLFAPGSDQPSATGAGLFATIGKALAAQPGAVTIEDHVAGDGGASLAFPDAVALSTARAGKVAAIVREQFADPARVAAKGMGGTVPLAPNDTPVGRAQNDRVEFIVARSS